MFVLLTIVISGCSVGQSVPMENHPKNMEEFEAEVELYSLDKQLNYDTARILLQQIYPEFEPVLDDPDGDKPFGLTKIYTFIGCEDSDDGLDINNAGTVYATYMDKDVKKRVSLKDRCTTKLMEGTLVEFYCSGIRPAKRVLNCSCWDERSCK